MVAGEINIIFDISVHDVITSGQCGFLCPGVNPQLGLSYYDTGLPAIQLVLLLSVAKHKH